MTRYPLALAAVKRLLGEDAPPPVGPFTIGASILRPPPSVAVPPSRAADDDDADDADAEPTDTDALLGELVDMVLVGDPDGGPKHEIHLVFKAEVLGGLHLRMQRRADGLFCTFLAADPNSRRMVEGHVDELLVRLRERGFKVAGHTVAVREGG